MKRRCIPALLLFRCLGGAVVGMTLFLVPISGLAENIDVHPALCTSVTHHIADANVAYVPGLDLHGNKVAPADLPGYPNFEMPVRVKVPLTLSLVRALNLKNYPYDKFGKGTEIYIGELEIEGRSVLLDGVPLTDPQQEKLSVLCMQAR